MEQRAAPNDTESGNGRLEDVGWHAGTDINVQQPGVGPARRVPPQHPVPQARSAGERPPGQHRHIPALQQELLRRGFCLRHLAHLLTPDGPPPPLASRTRTLAWAASAVAVLPSRTLERPVPRVPTTSRS